MDTQKNISTEKSVSFESIPAFLKLEPINGGRPIAQLKFLRPEVMEKEFADSPMIQIIQGQRGTSLIKLPKLIAGGLRMPHLHLEDKIILLNKEGFKKYLSFMMQEVDKLDDMAQFDQIAYVQ